MTPSDLLELFRREVDDTTEPYLWEDEDFFVYLNDAQDVFVRLTGGIADRRSPLTKITYKTGDQFKTYDERILRVKGAFDEQGRILGVRNLDNFETHYMEDDYGTRSTNMSLDDGRTGPIRFLVTDVEANEFQFYPLPDHDGFVRMYVYRRPLETIESGGDELEIPSQYHLNLLNWVKYLAYMKQDVEAFDGTRAAEFRSAFVDGVTSARRDKAAREDRKRIVQYGGI